MKPKDYLFPLVVIPLGTAFIIVAILLFVSKGKSKKLTAAKIKIGAALLSFSWLASCGGTTTTCYVPLEANRLEWESSNVEAAPGDTLKGHLFEGQFKYYSYKLSDTLTLELRQSGRLVPVDGLFDSNNEGFYFILDKNTPKGKYVLSIFGGNIESLEQQQEIKSYTFEVKD